MRILNQSEHWGSFRECMIPAIIHILCSNLHNLRFNHNLYISRLLSGIYRWNLWKLYLNILSILLNPNPKLHTVHHQLSHLFQLCTSHLQAHNLCNITHILPSHPQTYTNLTSKCKLHFHQNMLQVCMPNRVDAANPTLHSSNLSAQTQKECIRYLTLVCTQDNSRYKSHFVQIPCSYHPLWSMTHFHL